MQPTDDERAEDLVDLDAPEHSWWAAIDEPVPILEAPEHLWWAGPTDLLPPLKRARTFDAVPLAEMLDPSDPPASTPRAPSTGPYAVLRVANDAPWEEIVAAYRRQVRWWHPDGLGDAPAAERAACDERLRDLNQAFTEIKVRRARP